VRSPAPTETAVPTVVRYLALGDSYTAGEGLPPFDTSTGGCHRSLSAFPALVRVGDVMETTSRACSGATTADVLEREQHPGVGLQIDAVTPDVELVTITIGGNDLGFATVMSDCVFGRLPCSRLDGRVERALDGLAPRLERLYRDVRRRAPPARLVVVGYPHLVADPDRVDVDSCPSLVGPFSGGARITADEVRWLREKGEELGEVVQAAAAFAGHEACTAEPWMAGVTVAQVALSFHPNAAGHARMARLVSDRAER
jgi:lysophospholipase L1-like esterase